MQGLFFMINIIYASSARVSKCGHGEYLSNDRESTSTRDVEVRPSGRQQIHKHRLLGPTLHQSIHVLDLVQVRAQSVASEA